MALGEWLKGKTTELADRVKTAELGTKLKDTTSKVVEGVKSTQIVETVRERTVELTDRVKSGQLGEALKDATGKAMERVKDVHLDQVAKTALATAAQGVASYTRTTMKEMAERKAARRAEKERLEQLNFVINTRFPHFRFPRTPFHMTEYYGDSPNFYERLDLWEGLLKEWPHEPAHEAERQQREELYWRREVDRYLVQAGGNGNLVLAPKQRVLDLWWNFEKWNFRRYYAATGMFYASVFTSEVIEKWSLYRRDRNKRWNTSHPDFGYERAKFDQTADYLKNFRHHVIPAHREKWGNWYLFNVEQALLKRTALPARTFSKPSDDL